MAMMDSIIRTDMNGRFAVAVLAGSLYDTPYTRGVLEKASYIIAADAGLDHLYRPRILPNVVMGDMDSVSPEALAWVAEAGIPQTKYPERKNETDGEIAVDELLNYEADYYVIFGSIGRGRSDHMLGNLMHAMAHAQKAKREAKDFRIVLSDGLSIWLPLCGPTEVHLRGINLHGIPLTDYVVSFVQMSDVQGFTTKDMDYDVKHIRLDYGQSRAISNHVHADAKDPHISFDSGCGVLCLVRDVVDLSDLAETSG